MNLNHSTVEIFECEIGNRQTPEFRTGMVCSLIDVLAAGVHQSLITETTETAIQTPKEQHHVLKEGGNELV
ncbi:hypothetical protein LNA76_07290 [Alcaligenes sp. MMA]|uniref:hypothetical protein n=1 Tax=Alcaligenes sp. MMA TaxID=2893019 RepID=UPI001E64C86E|nr:hypothetical protein [Alcaligenes sp. MMA]MCC9163132.1 hypothetical protein [Alcaligenes sp. MMA]